MWISGLFGVFLLEFFYPVVAALIGKKNNSREFAKKKKRKSVEIFLIKCCWMYDCICFVEKYNVAE